MRLAVSTTSHITQNYCPSHPESYGIAGRGARLYMHGGVGSCCLLRRRVASAGHLRMRPVGGPVALPHSAGRSLRGPWSGGGKLLSVPSFMVTVRSCLLLIPHACSALAPTLIQSMGLFPVHLALLDRSST